MSKSLRVIFLSVLVVVFAVTSAFALDKYSIQTDGTIQDSTGTAVTDGSNYVRATGILTINTNGEYSFASGWDTSTITINNIVLDGSAAHKVTEVVFVVPTPTPDSAARGITGVWNITWPTQVGGNPRNKTHRVKLTLKKRSTNSAILAGTTATVFGTNWVYDDGTSGGAGQDLVLDVPIRVNATNVGPISVQLTIPDSSTMTFGPEAEIFADSSIQNYPSGYTEAANASFYTVHPGGELIIQNEWAIRGSNLTVNVYPGKGETVNSSGVFTGKFDGEMAKLTLDLPDGTLLDLRGRASTSSLERNAANGTSTVSTTYSVVPDALARAIADGAQLFVDGELCVLHDLTLYGYLQTVGQYSDGTYDQANTTTAPVAGTNVDGDQQTITKTGAGKLTIADSGTASDNSLSNYGKWAIPHALRYLNITEGAIELASKRFSWSAGRGLTTAALGTAAYIGPMININSGAEFIAGSQSLEEVTDDDTLGDTNYIRPIALNIYGTATFKDHAIMKRDAGSTRTNPVYSEIYPYEDYVTFGNGLTINALDIALDVKEGGKVVVDNGAFAVAALKGKGDIEIKNTTDSRDRAVLILTDSTGTDPDTLAYYDVTNDPDDYAHNYIDFQGKIYGQGANVGLYSPTTANEPFSRRIFRSADVTLDNLIVYGPAELNVNDATIARLENVKNIWLRGHRPGAVNFDSNGNVVNATAYSKLTVGKLNFIPNKAAKETIEIDGLKVDGSSSAEDYGELQILNYDNDAPNSDGYTPGAGTASVAPRYYDDDANRDNGELGPRINVYIKNLQLYANRGANLEFPTAYAKPATGIYALKLNGTEQPSRFIIDGTTVTGDGLEADVTNEIYPVQITKQSDVKFTGNGDWKSYEDYYPVAHHNSLLVKENAKLEIVRGGIVDGNLMFEPSGLAALGAQAVDTDGDGVVDTVTNAVAADVWPAYDSHANRSAYPADEDFYADDGWYDGNVYGFLNRYTTFSTQVGERNRNTTDTGGVYSVQVTGAIKLSADEGYNGNGGVVVRAKPDIGAFKGYEFTTIGQRFKALGRAEGTNGAFDDDFATSFNEKFQFRIPAKTADTNGVIVENRTELAIVELGDWSFMANQENFGQGAGRNFSIKVPFKVIVRGQEVTLKREFTPNEIAFDGVPHYCVDISEALGLGTGKYYFEVKPGFVYYQDGEEVWNEGNVGDIDEAFNTEPTPTFVSNDVTLRAEVDLTNSGDQFIRIIGTSRVEKTTPIRLALYLDEDVNLPLGLATTIDWLNGAVPAYRDYVFERNGGASTTPTTPTTPASQDVHPAPASGDQPGTQPGTDTPATTTFSIERSDESTMDDGDTLIAGRTYSMTFTADGLNASGAFKAAAGLTWNVTGLSGLKHSSTSGNTFTVEFVAQEGEDQSFTVTANNGTETVEYPVTFSAEAEDSEITFQTLAATSGSHDDVKAGYRVDFPAGTVASDTSYVWMPSWLKAVTNDDDEVVGVEFNDAAAGLTEASTTNVTVEATNADGDDVYYKWNVTRQASATDEPSDPGTTPSDPGTTPSDPGTTPSDPGTTPSDPGTTPSDPGTTPGTDTPTDEDGDVGGSSGGGCDAGFGALALALAAPLFLRRRRS